MMVKCGKCTTGNAYYVDGTTRKCLACDDTRRVEVPDLPTPAKPLTVGALKAWLFSLSSVHDGEFITMETTFGQRTGWGALIGMSVSVPEGMVTFYGSDRSLTAARATHESNP